MGTNQRNALDFKSPSRASQTFDFGLDVVVHA